MQIKGEECTPLPEFLQNIVFYIIYNYIYVTGFDKHKPEHAVELDSHTLHNIIDIDKYRSELQKVLDDLKHDYIHKLTLKTSAGR